MRGNSAFTRAGEILADRADHGRLLWAVGGRRCYAREAAGALTLTLTGAADMLVYVVEGVKLDDLT